MSSESRKQITYSRPLTPEKATHNFDDDNSSDEGACDQPIIVDGTHKINGAFWLFYVICKVYPRHIIYVYSVIVHLILF